jgi:hypothetical protein
MKIELKCVFQELMRDCQGCGLSVVIGVAGKVLWKIYQNFGLEPLEEDRLTE